MVVAESLIHKPPLSPPVMGEERHNSLTTENIVVLEARPFRPFKTSEEYLYAMKEDLAEWLHNLYGLNINVDTFFDVLETGVELCEHSNNVRRSATEQKLQAALNGEEEPSGTRTRKNSYGKWDIPPYDVVYRSDVAPGSFFARDNVHNFIRWCRDIGIMDVVLFETDDLVMRKNEKHVILSLLEVARRGTRFGMAAPLLVKMEQDIDREVELEQRRLELEEQRRTALAANGGTNGINGADGDDGWDTDVEDLTPEDPQLIYGPQAQLVTNDLRSLDERVRDLVERCLCPSQFPMVKVSDGKYRIGDTKVLIFVRILRNHVMVRVGGGWDTLEHYLDKHDPCRCRQGHRTTLSARVGYKTSTGSTGTSERRLGSVTYERCEEGGMSPLFNRKFSGSSGSRGMRRDSLDSRSLRQRSQSPSNRDPFTRTGSGRFSTTPRLSLGGGIRDDIMKPVNSSTEQNGWCDSSSEVSDEGYKSQGPPAPSTLPRARKPSPRKHADMDHRDTQDRPESVMTQLSSEGSSMSTDEAGNSPPSSPINNKTSSPLADKTNTWNQSKSTLKSPKNSTSKSKIPFMETLKNFASGNKKSKKSPLQEERPIHPPWNSGSSVDRPIHPPWNSGTGNRQRAHSVGTGRSISRSRSATSEGGFINMARDNRDMPPINSVRSPSRRASGNTSGYSNGTSGYSNGKNTWSGRASRERPSLTAETFQPPAPKTTRSASASPAPTRRLFGTPTSSASINRTPKRSSPITSHHFNNKSPVTSPTKPSSILDQLADLDPDENTLLCIKDIYDSLRAKVSESLAAEGKTLPPELCHDYTSSWINSHSTSGSQSLDIPSDPHNISPRKDGIGSRIPQPTFFLARQTQI